jgi:hypothetical protein
MKENEPAQFKNTHEIIIDEIVQKQNEETKSAIIDIVNGTFDPNEVHALVDFQNRLIPKPDEIIIFEKEQVNNVDLNAPKGLHSVLVEAARQIPDTSVNQIMRRNKIGIFFGRNVGEGIPAQSHEELIAIRKAYMKHERIKKMGSQVSGQSDEK